MMLPSPYRTAILAEFEDLPPHEALPRIRECIVSLQELMGYKVAQTEKPWLAKSVFILAHDIEKRLNALEAQLKEQD